LYPFHTHCLPGRRQNAPLRAKGANRHTRPVALFRPISPNETPTTGSAANRSTLLPGHHGRASTNVPPPLAPWNKPSPLLPPGPQSVSQGSSRQCLASKGPDLTFTPTGNAHASNAPPAPGTLFSLRLRPRRRQIAPKRQAFRPNPTPNCTRYAHCHPFHSTPYHSFSFLYPSLGLVCGNYGYEVVPPLLPGICITLLNVSRETLGTRSKDSLPTQARATATTAPPSADDAGTRLATAIRTSWDSAYWLTGELARRLRSGAPSGARPQARIRPHAVGPGPSTSPLGTPPLLVHLLLPKPVASPNHPTNTTSNTPIQRTIQHPNALPTPLLAVQRRRGSRSQLLVGLRATRRCGMAGSHSQGTGTPYPACMHRRAASER
jgi:hypothetical protein